MLNWVKRFYMSSFVIGMFFSTCCFAEDFEVAPQVQSFVEINLKGSVEVTKDVLLLSDIADCKGQQSMCDEIYGIELSSSPLPGQVRGYTRDWVYRVLTKEWPNAQIVMMGSKISKVRALSFDLDADDALASLRKVISEKTKKNKHLRVRLNSIQFSRKIKLRSKDFEYVFPDIANKTNLTQDWLLSKFLKSTSLSMSIVHENQIVATFKVRVDASVEADLPVALRNVKRGALIQKDDFQNEWVSLRKHISRYSRNISNVIGRKTKRIIRVGEPIAYRNLENHYDVKRGQLVQLLFKKGSLKITSKAKVLKSALKGEVVTVESLGTRRRVSAKVLNNKEVTLLY